MWDIVIVGGGMVGASLALALKPLQLKVALIEAVAFGSRSQPAYDDRSVALSYGSSRIYQGIGIWSELQTQVAPIKQIHVSDRGYFGATRIRAEQEAVPALGYVVESRVLGQVLFNALTGSQLEIISPATVSEFEQHADYVEVKFERQGLVEGLQTKLLVIADGAKSPLREQLGIEVKERNYQQTALIANVSTDKPVQGVAYERFTSSGPLALLPMTQGRYSLVWTHKTNEVEASLSLSDAEFLQKLQQTFGYRQGRFIKAGKRSSYPLSLIKSAAEVQGRAVLIGNASHTLHPVAGQGLNLALRDVASLSDLLAMQAQQHHDCGSAAMLATYQAARQADYKSVLGYTDSLVRLFSNDFPPLGHARAGGLLAVDRIAPLRKLLTQQSMGLRFRQSRLARGLALKS
ncbi:2-octaprenyl-6-methoxyphenyl hydroxylase [uncultured Thiothrix sp.]|uniref:2-octaprenyl-6-methoxyphenyl hydroxylase n=1 Tax=uncultured Thiothrix sp. TaxID=223185 RepID=UPI002628DA19|nr:2-octaprenyl-6-methoxyphenyl hydroxylase [uncultured Thiothrix sp.]HMT92846.1 2-octaprenyl-6-methoxyphenyl hydroxylase [Thiolinea sp.]